MYNLQDQVMCGWMHGWRFRTWQMIGVWSVMVCWYRTRGGWGRDVPSLVACGSCEDQSVRAYNKTLVRGSTHTIERVTHFQRDGLHKGCWALLAVLVCAWEMQDTSDVHENGKNSDIRTTGYSDVRISRISDFLMKTHFGLSDADIGSHINTEFFHQKHFFCVTWW